MASRSPSHSQTEAEEIEVQNAPGRREAVTVQTVTGPIRVGELGVTLTHEHVIGDFATWFNRSSPSPIAESKVLMAVLGRLRHDPFACRDNLLLDDEDVAAREVELFSDAGGRTILDPTCIGIGRDVLAQRRVSHATGVQIVAGSGYYVSHARPASVKGMSEEEIEAAIVRDVTEGVDGTDIRSGFIGEIGITDQSERISPEDERVLRGAARAQARTAVPLMVHLIDPLGDTVLDIIEAEGGKLDATVLCHMSHTQGDLAYQVRLAERGARLGYDSFGIDWYFPESDHQARSDDQQARAVMRLIEAGFGRQLLLSSDVFLKMQLVHYGGSGYAHVIENVLPRLRRLGVSEELLEDLVVANARTLFENAVGDTTTGHSPHP
jgi:phosphotriesterase-related protein